MKKLLMLLIVPLLFLGCDESSEKETPKECGNCETYQQCNTETNTCELKAGMCATKSDCTADQICSAAHTCITEVVFDCSSCDETYQQCNTAETACELQAGRCEIKSDCTDQSKPECDNTHTCIATPSGTIYPIQKGEVDLKSSVTVSATVTAIDDKGFFIQESGADYRGIYVYMGTLDATSLNIGDQVSVTGIYDEYKGLSQIKVDSMDNISVTTNQPITIFTELAASEVANNALNPYESMLIRVRGSFTVGATDEYGNTIVTDTNNKKITIRNSAFAYSLNSGDQLTEIRGVLTYNFNLFKILPRSIDDLIDNSVLCDAANCGTGELCEITNDVASCICDNSMGYYGVAGSCANPCLNNPCTETHKTVCDATGATTFECSCDHGYNLKEGICEESPSCNPTYYASALGKTGSALKVALKDIMSKTHHYDYSDYEDAYEAGKRAMFSHIYNEGGKVMGVYTGAYYNHPYIENKAEQTKTSENEFNCEHTWPKSKLGSGNSFYTAKADLHHLFPTFSTVNSSRSSIDFGETSSGTQYCSNPITDPDASCSGADYVSIKSGGVFEPADQHKGNVARAMLYMAIRYDLNMDQQFDYFQKWHKNDPVTEIDRTRNDMIETYQYNRNPFIDCPQFVDAVYQ